MPTGEKQEKNKKKTAENKKPKIKQRIIFKQGLCKFININIYLQVGRFVPMYVCICRYH